MTNCNPGDIVILEMPLGRQDKLVRRPAVVVNPPTYTASQDMLIVLPLTTRAQSDPRLALKLWEPYGLPKVSWIKPQLISVPRALAVRTLSSLAAADHDAVRRALRQLIDENW